MLSIFGPGPYFPGALSGTVPVVPGPVSRTAVLLAFGQSNMVDQSRNDNTVAWPANVQVLDTPTQTYITPGTQLRWLERVPGATGDWDGGPGQLVKHFATDWCAANPDDTLIVVPGARGGTGFLRYWMANGNGDLYNETVRLLDRVFADHPTAEFLAMLAQHGEKDAVEENNTYLWNAGEMIAQLRARYDVPTLPVIWGEPGPTPQFTDNTTPGHDAVRDQIRRLPAHYRHVATVRETDTAAFDALTDLDGLHFDAPSQKKLGAMHYDALADARAHTDLPQTDVTLIWQTAGEHGWLNYGIPVADLDPGDTLVVLACGHRSSGRPYISGLDANGTAGTVHLQELAIQNSRLGLSVASVTLDTVPTDGLLPVDIVWDRPPSGGTVAIWRVRGGTSPGAGSVAHSAALGPLSVDLTAGLPGPVVALGYALDTGQRIAFAGDGEVLAGGSGNTNKAYFTSRRQVVSGGTASFGLTPSATPSHVCGMVAVAVG